MKKRLLLAVLLAACKKLPPSSGAIDSNFDDYTPLTEIGQTYPTAETFDVQQGTLSVWVKFSRDARDRRDHLIFSTDDSRYVLFVDIYSSGSRQVLRIGARAGGNRRIVDSGYKGGNFPEASIIVNNDGSLSDYGKNTPWYSSVPFPEGEWHHVAMTWQGYPEGVVRIYLEGELIGEKPFDGRYDDGRPPASSMAVGARPRKWTGEIVQNTDGSTSELVPRATMELAAGGIQIQDLRLYQREIPLKDIKQLQQESAVDTAL